MASASSNNKLRAFLDKEPASLLPNAEYSDPKAEKFIYAKTECVLFRLPWKYPDRVILYLMAKWLEENRPTEEKPAKISGKEKTGKTRLQNMKERLKMLGKWRLVKKNHGDISTLHPLESKPLFRDRWRWDETERVIIRERGLFTPLEESRRNVLPPRGKAKKFPQHKRPYNELSQS
jgi:hypothetical protein